MHAFSLLVIILLTAGTVARVEAAAEKVVTSEVFENLDTDRALNQVPVTGRPGK